MNKNINGKKRIVEHLEQKPHHISTIAGPYLLDENDPKHRISEQVQKEKSRKVLTISKPRRILNRVLKRKDDKPMPTKSKTQTNYMQNGAIALLAVGAVEGVTQLLGGELRDAVVAAILVFVLFALAVDYRK